MKTTLLLFWLIFNTSLAGYAQTNHSVKDERKAKEKYLRGLECAFKGRDKRALKFYKKSIELNPFDLGPYNGKSSIYIVDKNYEKAEEIYSFFIELNPANPFGYIYRGYARELAKKYEESEEDYSKSIELNPEDARVYYYRGNIRKFSSKDDLAIEDYLRAIELDSTLEKPYFFVTKLLEKEGKYNAAIENITKIINIGCSDLNEAFFIRANLYWKTNENEKACDDWKRAQQLNHKMAISKLISHCSSYEISE